MYRIAASTLTLSLVAAGVAFAQTGPPTRAESPRAADSPATPTRSGSSSSALTPADVKMMIEGAGYSQVTDVQQTVGGYSATAVKHGKRMTLELDPNGRLIEPR
jgi:hypothetical protein